MSLRPVDHRADLRRRKLDAHAHQSPQFRSFRLHLQCDKSISTQQTALGDGNVEFHLERGTISIEHMHYFNRGTEIRAVATVDQLWKFPNSPFNGTAYITARPLKNLKLPVLSDFDSVLVSLQTSLALTGVRVEGTIKKNRKIGPIGITDMTDEMQRFLVGDVKKELQSDAGD